MIISRSIVLIIKNIPDKSCRENQNTHFMFNKLFSENHAVHEIMWENMVQPDRPQRQYNAAHALYMLDN